MMRVLEQAVAKIEGLPEERQRAAAEALEDDRSADDSVD